MDPNKLHELYTEEDEEEKSFESKVPLWGWILIIVGVTILLIALIIIIFFLVRTKLQLRDTTDELIDTRRLVHRSYISDEDIKTAEESIEFLDVLSSKIGKIMGLRSCPPCRIDPCSGESTCARKPFTRGATESQQTITIPATIPPIKSTSPTSTIAS